MPTLAERLFWYRRPPEVAATADPKFTLPETVHLHHHHLWATKEWNTKFPLVHLLFTGYPEGPGWLVEEPAESLIPLVAQLANQNPPAALVQFYTPLSPLSLAHNYRRFPPGLCRRLDPATHLTLTAYSMGTLTVPHLPPELLERLDAIHLVNPFTGRDHFAEQLTALRHPAAQPALNHLFHLPTTSEWAGHLSARLSQLSHPPAITYHWAKGDEYIDHLPAIQAIQTSSNNKLSLSVQPLPQTGHAITRQNLLDILYPPN